MTYLIRNIRNLLREHETFFIADLCCCRKSKFGLQINRLELSYGNNMDAAFASLPCPIRFLPCTFRLIARITGKSCVSKTPNLEGQRVSFNGQGLCICNLNGGDSGRRKAADFLLKYMGYLPAQLSLIADLAWQLHALYLH